MGAFYLKNLLIHRGGARGLLAGIIHKWQCDEFLIISPSFPLEFHPI